MSPHPSLLSIIAYARSGALDYACRLFLEGGFELVDSDPAVLSVRGRLLKDRALAAESAAERRRLYLESAEAYARAGEIGGQTYPLINAATLSLLAGRREQSLALAKKLFARLLAGGNEMETPYYRAATHAEALLLLGDIAGARKHFTEAIALAPRAYEDHASTLRQFALILEALGEDASWLDPLRPPRSLHFSGDAAARPAPRAVRALIKKERIGYGYGVLASRADLVIAQALLDEGAELHLVFAASKTRLGDGAAALGAKAFERIVDRATTVRAISSAEAPFAPRAVQLAAEVAMGCAAMQASTLMTEAVQLVVPGASADWSAALWKKSGRRQFKLAAPRAPSRRAERVRADGAQRAAMLRIDLSEADGRVLAKTLLPALARALAKGPKAMLAPRWTGEAVLAAYDTTAAAARAALDAAAALGGAPGARIAGHYALVHRAADAFGGKPFLLGPATHMLTQVVRSTPSGAVHLTEDFAAALHAGAAKGRPRTEYVGDLPSETIEEAVRLFSLKR